jgi:Na+-driven multidrug efflux pump
MSYIFLFGIDSINMIFIGRQGNAAKLAGVGMAGYIIGIFILGPILGIVYTQSTFISQSYGKGDHKQCGHYFNKIRVVCFGYWFLISSFLFFTEDILVGLGMNADIAYYTQ